MTAQEIRSRIESLKLQLVAKYHPEKGRAMGVVFDI